MIVPSRDGSVYVTPDVYTSGQAAQANLTLSRTLDGYFQIPTENVAPMNAPKVVEPANGQPGGGIEIQVPQSVSTDDAIWKGIDP